MSVSPERIEEALLVADRSVVTPQPRPRGTMDAREAAKTLAAALREERAKNERLRRALSLLQADRDGTFSTRSGLWKDYETVAGAIAALAAPVPADEELADA